MFWIVFGIITLVKFVTIIFLGPGDDEAYFWACSKNLELAYFDHPPMVAYVIKVFTSIFGNNPFAIHAGALVLTSCSILIAYKWLREMFSEEETLWGSLLFMFAPVIFMGGVIMAPDAPLALFWTLSLYLLYRALKEQKNLYWYLTGISMGLASLSKYNGFILPVMMFLYLILSKNHRPFLKKKEPYITLLLSIIVFLPVIIWNAQNDWVSFHFQFVGRHRFSLSIVKFLLFVASQMLYLAPTGFIIAMCGFTGLARLWKKKWEYRYLFLMSFPVIALFAANSLYSHKFLPHWPALGYIGGFMGAAAAIKLTGKYKLLLKLNLAVCSILIAFLIVSSFHPVIPLAPNAREKDFTNDFYGWDLLKKEVETLTESLPDDIFYLAERYQTGAQFSLATNKPVWVKRKGRTTGYDFWQDIDSRKGMDALYFTHSRLFANPKHIYRFRSIKLLKEIPVKRAGIKVRTLYLYFCSDFRGTK